MTHHRTGTVLFQSIIRKLTQQYYMDFERVDGGIMLKDLNATESGLNVISFRSSQVLQSCFHHMTYTHGIFLRDFIARACVLLL